MFILSPSKLVLVRLGFPTSHRVVHKCKDLGILKVCEYCPMVSIGLVTDPSGLSWPLLPTSNLLLIEA